MSDDDKDPQILIGCLYVSGYAVLSAAVGAGFGAAFGLAMLGLGMIGLAVAGVIHEKRKRP